MTTLRLISFGYMIALLAAASLNYIPGLTDAEGRAFGIFALDIYDDSLHVASAAWAGIAAFVSHRAARIFLTYFGLLYLLDGLLGLVTGSGFLDLGIVNYGILDLPFGFKILANLPHIALGGFALLSVRLFGKGSLMIRRLWRVARRLLVALLVLIVLLLAPVAWIETFCRSDPQESLREPLLADPQFLRAEANTYLTYPEWHIVYAYEGLANILRGADEYAFGYASSVSGFWKSFCALNRVAGRHGGADLPTRVTIHTIGVSFTLEMALKALYEETLGRLFALLRGADKTPQDLYAAEMAADYAAFLQQVPWYRYDFDAAVAELWSRPTPAFLRGWERRIALGIEWKAKAAYARAIAGAVAASGQAQLRIRSVVTGLDAAALAAIAEVDIVETDGDHVVIETPRYRAFTGILRRIAGAGGKLVEIAGNDDIMASVIVPSSAGEAAIDHGETIARIARDGYGDDRVLVAVKVAELSAFIDGLAGGAGARLEHVYDY